MVKDVRWQKQVAKWFDPRMMTIMMIMVTVTMTMIMSRMMMMMHARLAIFFRGPPLSRSTEVSHFGVIWLLWPDDDARGTKAVVLGWASGVGLGGSVLCGGLVGW